MGRLAIGAYYKRVDGTLRESFGLGLPATAPKFIRSGIRTFAVEEAGTTNLGWLRHSHLRSIRSVSSSQTLTLYDDIIKADATGAPITITLPDASSCPEKSYLIKKVAPTGANTVTVATSGGQTIDGDSSKTIVTQWSALEVISDGSNWLVI